MKENKTIIIKSTPESNGAYDNQTWMDKDHIPKNYALIPASINIPNTFPFVYAEIYNGVVTNLSKNQEAYDKAMSKKPEKECVLTNEELTNVLSTLLS